MRFVETRLTDCYVIEIEPHRDERGFFARTFCQSEYAAHGLDGQVLQGSLSHNARRGTLRGMHFQLPPMQEVKQVRCVRGAVHDVVVDLRPNSETFLQYEGVMLSAENGRSLYVPAGFAHGFITLEDDTDLLYQMSQFHDAAQARGVRWDDPLIGIEWPMQPCVISKRDQTLPNFNVVELGGSPCRR